MIHKFILGRCVQCNLPVEDLTRVGWECCGHDSNRSNTDLQHQFGPEGSASGQEERCLTTDNEQAKIVASAPAGCTCPKCSNKCAANSSRCPSCSFDFVGFRNNLSHGKYVEMTPVAATDKSLKAALKYVYLTESGKSGCTGWVLLTLSPIVVLIPIFGWIISPLLLFQGLVLIIAPASGSRFLDSIVNGRQYRARLVKARRLLSNSYQNIECPNCHNVQKEYSWKSSEGHMHCTSCCKKLMRYEDYLCYVPNPDLLATAGDFRLLLSHLAGWPSLAEPAAHEFHEGSCIRCGCTESAVMTFGWKCYGSGSTKGKISKTDPEKQG